MIIIKQHYKAQQQQIKMTLKEKHIKMTDRSQTTDFTFNLYTNC